jgi:hypothetical protein
MGLYLTIKPQFPEKWKRMYGCDNIPLDKFSVVASPVLHSYSPTAIRV